MKTKAKRGKSVPAPKGAASSGTAIAQPAAVPAESAVRGGIMGVLARSTTSPILWAVVACTLLLCSGAIRQWRDLQFSGAAREGETCPFPLDEVPRSLGAWYSNPKLDDQLPPEIADIAGSSAHFVRVYEDASSGQAAQVLVLYGLATSVFAHSPDICYRAFGFNQVALPKEAEITVPESAAPVRYNVLYFSRRVGGATQQLEVVYTFLHNGQWLPETASRWKMFRHHPGMFKIQIERNVAARERDPGPSVAFLSELVRAIDARVAKAKAGEERGEKRQGR